MTEMREKWCVITGATSGIGYEVSLAFALQGARVIGIGRDADRCAAAEKRIRETARNGAVFFEVADLSSRAEVRSLAVRLGKRLDRVDVLVNNAGIFTLSRRESVDGIEMQLAVNWLAGFMLTGLLLPLLRAAPRARIITLSSGSHFSGNICWNDIGLRRGYAGLKAYAQSKLATVLFTYELASRLGPGSPISVHAVDPGLVKTEIGMKGTGPIARLVWKIRIRRGIPARQSAQSVAFLAADPVAEEMTGLYWKEKKPLPSSKSSNDPKAARRLWDMGEEMCGVRYPREKTVALPLAGESRSVDAAEARAAFPEVAPLPAGMARGKRGLCPLRVRGE